MKRASKLWTRIGHVFLSVVLILGLLPVSAWAEPSISEEEAPGLQAQSVVTDLAYSGGAGTKASPYIIATEADLISLMEAVNGGQSQSGGYFQLSQDIEVTSESFQPIGIYTSSVDYPFAGTFDGDGHTVTLNMTYKGSGQTGLFGYTCGQSMRNAATIKNVTVAGSLTAKQYICGGIVGYAVNTIVEQCGNEAALSGTGYVGGIVGSSMLTGTSAKPNTVRIIRCYNTGNIQGPYVGAARIGGIIGAYGSASESEITDCYNGGNLTTGGTMAGGIVGDWYNVSGASAYMDNCYNYGTITGGYKDNTCALVASFNGTTSGTVCSYINNCHTQVLKAYCSGASTGKLFGWYGSNVQIEGTSAKMAVEMPLAAFVDELGESYAQTATQPVLRWQAPLNPTVGSLTAQGITSEGGLAVGDTATLTVDARLPLTGEGASGTLSYQWYRSNSETLDPATDTLLEATNASAAVTVPASGDYYFYCVVTNTLNGQSASLTSPYFMITAVSGVEPATPTITLQPQGGQRPQEGDSLELSVAVDETVAGIGTLSYQWYVIAGQSADAQAIAGATGPTYVASASKAGTYTYYCVVTNTFDLVELSATSQRATLNVSPGEIGTAEELQAFAQRVNGSSIRKDEGENLEGKTFVLTADIDLSGIDWTPVGTYYYDVMAPGEAAMNEFSGIFDGAGHTISGLSVDKEKLSYWHNAYAGLFGYTKNATIKNLVVKGTVVTDGLYYVGGIVGYAAGATTLENLIFEGDVSGASRVGGIVGMIGESSGASVVRNCGMRGSVTGKGYAAGIAGVAGNTAFSNCYNWAAVDAKGFMAGIVGSVYQGYNVGNVSIGNCYNAGKITCLAEDPESTLYFGAIVSDYATSYPQNNYYLESSCTRDATLGSPAKNLAKTQAYLRSADFVTTLNSNSGSEQAVFVANTQGMYPVFAWETQQATCGVTVNLSPAGAHDATVEVRDSQGVICLPVALEGLPEGASFYYLPLGSYTVKASLYGFATLERTFEVTQTDEPMTISLEMASAPTQYVSFSVASAQGASTTGALLWLTSDEFGLIKQGVRLSALGNLSLPAGTYSYTWVLSDHMSASGSFEVTEEGAQLGEVIRLSVTLQAPAAWDGSQIEPVQSKDGYYLITRGEELAWCAGLVNQGASQTNMRLMASIVLNDSDYFVNQWTPIGGANQVGKGLFEGIFTGDFDGQGYDISGLYIDAESDYQGLFGVAGNGATFENVVVSGFVRTSGAYAAGLVAYAESATITFTNCGNEATVTAQRNVGGIMGQSWSGAEHAVTLTYCYNKGAIKSTEATNYEAGMAGGLVGSTFTGDETCLVLKSCYNAGSVLALSHTAGGLVGTGSCTLQNCFNIGAVEHRSLSDVYANASGALLGVWMETGVGIKITNCSYLEGSNERAFGYVNVAPSATVGAFEDPDYFDSTTLAGYEGFVKRYGSAFNDGYPYLSWENTSRIAPIIPDLPGSEGNPYKISTVEDLQALAENVAAGRTYGGEFVSLENDLDLTGVDFEGIGTYANGSGGYFSGTFDGQGHCISGLNIQRHTTDSLKDQGAGVGLFGYTRNATITHLEVTGVVSGTIWVGGVVGYAYATHVTNCLSRVDVSATPFEEGDGQGIYACGIVGQSFADVEGDGSVMGCAYYGTASYAAIVGLGTSKTTVMGNFYASANNTRGTDQGTAGADGVENMADPEVAWRLNTFDNMVDNSLIWGVAEDGVRFCNGVDVLPTYRVIIDNGPALFSCENEYFTPGSAPSVTIIQPKKGYTLKSGVIARIKTEVGTYQTVYTGAIPSEYPATYVLPALSSDVVVGVDYSFNRNTLYDLNAVCTDENGGSTRSATVTFFDEDGVEITQAKEGAKVTARISNVDEASQFKDAYVKGFYDAAGTSWVYVLARQLVYSREYTFEMPDADATFMLGLEQKGTLPGERDESLDVEASAFHVANPKYSSDGTLLNADFIVDDDGTAGITTYYYDYPQQAVSSIYKLEGGLTSDDYYSQMYSVLDAQGNWTLQQYTGIDIERYLTKWCGMNADLAADTLVTFINAAGESVALTVGDLRGYGYAAYQTEGDYTGDFVARGLPVLLAAGVDNEAFDPQERGPLCLVVGQTSATDANASLFLSDVRKIVVGDVSQAVTATHQNSPYDEYLNDQLPIDVYRAGEFVKTVYVSMSQLEALQAQGAGESAWITGARFGSGGQLQNVDELDHYQGTNIWQMLLSVPDLGVTDYDLSMGSASFYEMPLDSWSGYGLVAQVPLSYLAGSGDAYASCETVVNGLVTTGVAPQIATAKNGLPLVYSANDAGAVDDEYNYRGPFIGVLPYSENAGVQVPSGGEKNAYVVSFLGRVVLDLGEACDKTDLEWLLDAVEKDVNSLVASDDGSDVSATASWVPTSVWTALVAAQTAAQAVDDDPSSTSSQVSEAYDTLSAAWQAAMDQRRDPASASTLAVSDDLEALEAEGEAADAAAQAVPLEASYGAPKSVVSTDAGQYVADEILVTFAEGTSKGQALGALSCIEEADEDEVAHEVSEANVSNGALVVVKLDEGVDVLDAVAAAQQREDIVAAQPNFVYTTFENDYTNDPALDDLAPSKSAPNAWQLDSIKALDAWSMVKTNNTVTIAVLDTGCYLSHEDLKNQIWQDYAWNATLSASLTKDYNGHGTHVAGLAAAEANNALGTAGSSYNAKILPICVFDTSGERCYTNTLVSAYDYLLDYAEELNIHVVNMSLGGYGSLDSYDYMLQGRIATAKNKGIVTVAAGGNGDDYGNPRTDASWPSDFEECVAVTALSTDGASPTTWCDYNSSKDICAPGLYLYSTYSNGPSSYKVMSGTSMASPVVAGALALLWAADPNLTVDEAKELIYSTAAPLTVVSGREGLYGHGILDIAAAVQALSGLVISTETTDVYSSQTLQMTCRSTNGQSVDNVVWSVTNGTGTATIDAATGLLTGLMPGTVTVSASLPTVEGMADTVEVTVKALEMTGAPVVTPTSQGLQVDWLAAAYAAGYVLERSTDGETFQQISTLPAETLTYLDESVEENVLYFYRVTPYSSVASEGTGMPSAVARSMKFQLITMVSAATTLATSDEALALAVDVFASRDISLDSLILISDGDDAWSENAAALACAGNGYVVAVGPEGLSAQALSCIAQLAPEKIVALGDETAVSEGALQAAAESAGVAASRVSQGTRALTDVAAVKEGLGQWGDTVVICAPSQVSAAVKVASYAAAGQGAPILLTKETQAPFEVETLLAAKHFSQALVLGDSAVIATSADGFLARQGIDVERISLENVSANMAKRAAQQGNSWNVVGVHAGQSSALAQVAASFASALGGVSCDTSYAALTVLSQQRQQVQAAFVFAPESLKDQAQQSVSDALNGLLPESDFEVSKLPYVTHYSLVTYYAAPYESAGVTVAGIPLVKCGDVYCSLIDVAAAASLTAADFRVTSDPAPQLTSWGDVNENAQVNIVDAQIAYDLATGRYDGFQNVSMKGWLAADYNRDGFLDAADAFAIQVAIHRGVIK